MCNCRIPLSAGINTPRKFRASLRYLRHMILERQSAVQALRPGDEVLESTDDQDSGVRTNSEPTSPLTSEGESDGILASHFGVSSTAADTAHRCVGVVLRYMFWYYLQGIPLNSEENRNKSWPTCILIGLQESIFSVELHPYEKQRWFLQVKFNGEFICKATNFQ